MSNHPCRDLVAQLALGIVLVAASTEAGVLDATWTAPTTNTDGSRVTDLESYRVHYGVTASPCEESSAVEVPSSSASPAAGETESVRLRGLETGTRYYVAVSAVDQDGNESECSPPANAVAQSAFGVSPSGTLSFGSVNPGSVVDRTLTVSSTRVGTVAGTVSTSPPFSIVSGGSFTLTGADDTHTVHVRFSPSASGTASASVNVTADGDSVSRVVTGTGLGSGATGPPLPPSPGTTAPTVEITSPTTADTFRTRASSVTLSGMASGDVGVTQVTWSNDRGGSGTASGTTSWTASGIALRSGTNVLTITAQDAAGNTQTATLTVTRSRRGRDRS
jgi:Bacterial Ig domain/Fibronectin type III domain